MLLTSSLRPFRTFKITILAEGTSGESRSEFWGTVKLFIRKTTLTGKEESLQQSRYCVYPLHPLPPLSLEVSGRPPWLGPCTVPGTLWTSSLHSWITDPMEWLQVIRVISALWRPNTTMPSYPAKPPNRLLSKIQAVRQREKSNNADQRHHPCHTYFPPGHIGNVCVHQGEIWYQSMIKGPTTPVSPGSGN